MRLKHEIKTENTAFPECNERNYMNMPKYVL